MKTASVPLPREGSASRLGFTLIELLVAVATVALMAVLLWPTLEKSRERGRQIQCLANMRQIMQATHLYANDFENYLPFCGAFPPPVGVTYSNCWAYGWSVSGSDPQRGQLWPYHKSLQVLMCPCEDTNAAYFRPRFTMGYQTVTSYNYSTSAAGFPTLRNGPDAWNKGVGLKLNSFRPDGLLAWEPPERLPYVMNDGAAEPEELCSTRHNGGAIVGCYGGGAEHMSSKLFGVEEKQKPSRVWCKPDSPNGD
jgi:type II secretory pathway pseudopilin PulG